jgi:ubiquinol-cytochrome c reductase cytochrome c subunit
VSAIAARRRHPLMLVLILFGALLVTGFAYAAASPKAANADTTNAGSVDSGRKLFLANCATCHGLNAQGTKVAPTLIGVGAAAVDFQVGTGRMPASGPDVQIPQRPRQFAQQDISDMAAYVASLAPGPAVPDAQYTDPKGGDVALGGQLFRVNCAMCHNFAGSGGALTRGKYAPSLMGVSGRFVYEAMITGPQSMPVFSDTNIAPQSKQDIIAYLNSEHTTASPGGLTLGNLGTVPEGLFAWVAGLTVLIGCAVWLGSKSA